jgi:hypothetical protein
MPSSAVAGAHTSATFGLEVAAGIANDTSWRQTLRSWRPRLGLGQVWLQAQKKTNRTPAVSASIFVTPKQVRAAWTTAPLTEPAS